MLLNIWFNLYANIMQCALIATTCLGVAMDGRHMTNVGLWTGLVLCGIRIYDICHLIYTSFIQHLHFQPTSCTYMDSAGSAITAMAAMDLSYCRTCRGLMPSYTGLFGTWQADGSLDNTGWTVAMPAYLPNLVTYALAVSPWTGLT